MVQQSPARVVAHKIQDATVSKLIHFVNGNEHIVKKPELGKEPISANETGSLYLQFFSRKFTTSSLSGKEKLCLVSSSSIHGFYLVL